MATEHTGIRGMLMSLEQQQEMRGLAAGLEKLHGVLRAHFELEEGSGGLAHVIGGAAPNLLDVLHRILSEHDGILVQVRDLMGLVHEQRASGPERVKAEVDSMIARIRAHEAAESELLSSVTSEEPGGGD